MNIKQIRCTKVKFVLAMPLSYLELVDIRGNKTKIVLTRAQDDDIMNFFTNSECLTIPDKDAND